MKPRRYFNSIQRGWVVAFLIATFASGGNAANNSWTNTADNSWEVGGNWSLGTPPSSTDSILITNNGTFTVNLNNTTANTDPGPGGWMAVATLTVGNNSGLSTLLIDFTNTTKMLTVGGAGAGNTILGDGASQHGTLILNQGAIRSDQLTVGNLGIGELKINGGSNILTGTFPNFYIGKSAGGIGSVTMSGGYVESPYITTVGNSGQGAFVQSNGMVNSRYWYVGSLGGSSGTLSQYGGTNVASGGYFRVAGSAGSTGSVLVAGGLLRLTNNAAAASIGMAGRGALTISDGRFTTYYDLVVGDQAGSRGEVTMSGGIMDSLGVTTVGSSGQGTFVQSNGTINSRWWVVGSAGGSSGTLSQYGGTNVASGGYLRIGNSAGNTGTVLLAGGLLRLTNNAAAMSVGNTGYGTFTMSDGHLVTDWYLTVGDQVGSTGQVMMTGGTMDSSYINTVGSSGQGTFVQSNGTINSRYWLIGSLGGSSGTLSQYGGTNVASGGYLYIGSSAGSTGSVLVAGGVLRFTNTASSFHVGYNGVGSITVTNSGQLFADILRVGASTAGRGSLNVYGGQGEMIGALHVGNAASATGNVTVANTGVLQLDSSVTLGNASAGLGTITNRDGGTVRFSRQNNPTISVSPGSVFVTRDATIEFKDTASASLAGSISNSISYAGNNTLGLNHASNAPVGSYTFRTNNLPNFSALKLSNDGAFLASTVTVGAGGVISGNGTVSGATTVQGGGTISPGNSPGVLHFVNNLTMESNSVLRMDIGPVLFDQVTVIGTVNISNSLLQIVPTANVTSGTFVIIDNDGTIDFTQGEFQGITNNSFIDASANGFDAFFRIQYNAGDGNDVVLFATIPEPSSLMLMLPSILIILSWRCRRCS